MKKDYNLFVFFSEERRREGKIEELRRE